MNLPFLRRLQRAHPGGQSIVQTSDMSWGHDRSQFVSPDHGDYIATSNAVYSAVTLRSRLISTLPLRVMRNGEATQNGRVAALLQHVNPHWTLRRLLWATESAMCLWGECFWVLDRDSTEIWWVKPTNMRVLVDPDKYIKGFLLESEHGVAPIPFKPNEVIWFRYPNPLDEFSGLSPMGGARIGADLEAAGAHANRNLFANGFMAGGILAPDGDKTWSPEQAKEAEELIGKRFRGFTNAHKWMVARQALKIQKLDLTPKDAEFLGTMRIGLDFVARALGVPQEMIGGERAGLTYANVREMVAWLWEVTLRPESQFLAAELTEQLVPIIGGRGESVEFDLSGVEALRETEQAKWTRVLSGFKDGLYGPKTAHQMLGIKGDVIDEAPKPPVAPQMPQDESKPEPEPDTSTDPEDDARAVVAELLRRQRSSVLSAFKGPHARSDADERPFDLPKWVREWRVALRGAGVGTELWRQQYALSRNTALHQDLRSALAAGEGEAGVNRVMQSAAALVASDR